MGSVLPIDLGDGLALRRATADDIEALIAFNTRVHGQDGEPNTEFGASTADLLGKRIPHPTTSPDNFTLVEDTATGAIASSLCLIPQTWTYGGVSFPATLVEMVGTAPEYRNRGLVRRQFEVAHDWCAERGILVQAITGIPWYYRQFGYEYALQMGLSRTARRETTPKLEGDEPVRLRDATIEDVAFIVALDESARGRWLVTTVRDDTLWRYEIDGRDAASDDHVQVRVIEQAGGRPAGYVACVLKPDDVAWVESFEIVAEASWLEIVPGVLRHLLAVIDVRGDAETRETYAAFDLGPDHPAYRAMPNALHPYHTDDGLYMRVADLPAFLTRIAPVLEARLAASTAAGHSGELPINFYRSGVRLTFKDGKLASVTSERMEYSVAASFPDLSFLQLLFGYRSLAELDAWYPDCRIRTNEARVLLDALFPKQPSFVWPVW